MDEHNDYHRGDGSIGPRRKSDFAVISLVVGLIFPVGGLIWQGAKLDAAVEQLQDITSRQEASTREDRTWRQQMQERLRVLELQRLQDDKRTDDMERRLREKGVF